MNRPFRNLFKLLVIPSPHSPSSSLVGKSGGTSMSIAKGDFVELDYTGALDDGMLFDTTDVALAKKHGLNSNGPVLVVIGEKHVLPGLDTALVGKELGKSYAVKLQSENAFGKRSADMMQLVPTKRFHEQKINPYPGLRINLDNMQGLVRSVSGGRVIVDFNHPLSGRDVQYEFTVKKKVTDLKEKVVALIALQLGQKDAPVRVEGKDATVALKFELPKELVPEFNKEFKRLIPELGVLHFSKEETKKTTEAKT
jgi:FKBP-type peptidyl-prolyl cis-trans isomerase 2